MGKKRKAVATNLDEVDRTFFATFCSAANSLSQLYTQAMNHQKISFHAGERLGLEKLYAWILRQQEAGARVTTTDILNYLQNEIECCGDEPSMSPRAPAVQNHHPQAPMHAVNPGFLASGPSAQIATVQGTRSEQYDNQTKNSVFSNALSSPVRRTLQHYNLAQGGYYPGGVAPPGSGARIGESNAGNHPSRDSNSNDTSMDMHQDSPGPESNY